jgi:hypothetical protein
MIGVVKKVLALLTLVMSGNVFAQFADDFSDGDFTNNPTWTGTTDKFVVDAEQLRLMAPAANGEAWLVTPSAAINDAVWQCRVRLLFNPSSSNLARIYLTASLPDLSASLNGYYVQIGGTDDEISLYRQDGTTSRKIIDGANGRVNTDPVDIRIRVTRSAAGVWQLFSDVGVTGNFIEEGTATDFTHASAAYFGIKCVYTSTRASSFYFDDFEVSGNPYMPPPPAQYKQVVFTELFPDPDPPVALPEFEFVELYNRSDAAINLAGWKFSDATSTATLPSFNLLPGKYVILAPAEAVTFFQVYGDVIGLSAFPVLNNTSDQLALRDPYDNLIDEVNYTDAWYRDRDKKNGGWSLELIDEENICAEESNWAAAVDVSGGTPGRENSIRANKPDVTGPRLLSVFPESPTRLVLYFDEKMDRLLPPVSHFRITPPLGITAVSFGPTLRQMVLDLSESLQPKQEYILTVKKVYDCSGNAIEEHFSSAKFGLPEPAAPGDVVINELLFNPRPFGVDFLEVYNRSNKYINLKNWRLGNHNGTTFINARIITADNLLLPPRGIMAFTADPITLQAHYPQAAGGVVVKALNMPSFPDDEGSASVVTEGNELSDYFFYNKSYHSVFLRDKEGVSLERINPEAPTNLPANWKSAASTAGFATPGLPNSNTAVTTAHTGQVGVYPEIFVPQYGYPDFTEIRYAFETGGKVANVKILDQQGREIKTLAQNELLGTEGFFRWDGDRADGTVARPGYYIVWFEVFDGSGRVETFRKRVVLAMRQ